MLTCVVNINGDYLCTKFNWYLVIYTYVERLLYPSMLFFLQPCSVPKLPKTDLTQLCKLFDTILMTDSTVSSCSTDDTLTDSVLTLPPDVWRVINGVITNPHTICSRDCLQRYI